MQWKLVRTGSAPEPQTYQSRSATFGAAVRNAHNATLITVNDPEGGLDHYVQAKSERLAFNAASAVGAKAEPVDNMPELSTDNIVRMVAVPNTDAARETQAGADPNQVAFYLRNALEPGYWIGVSVRNPRRGEITNTRRWYDHRLGNTAMHHSRAGEAVAVSIWAGGPDRRTVDDIINGAVAAMPGFDIEVQARKPIGAPTLVFLSVLAGLGVWFGLEGLSPWWSGLGTPRIYTYAALAALFVFAVVSVFANPLRRARSAIAKGTIPPPHHKLIPPRRPRKERITQEKTIHAHPGTYPLAMDVFVVGPSVVVGTVSPHTGESTDAAATKMRSVPAALRKPIGPAIGMSGEHLVHISQEDRFGGVASFGRPGSGKSNFVTNVYAYDVACRVRGQQGHAPLVPGDTGARSTLIAFENKGRDGLETYRRHARDLGDAWMEVEVADPSTPAIDMFPPVGSAEERAAFFVDSMVYTFGDQAIGNRSQNTLNYLTTAALLTTPQDIERANQELGAPLSTELSPLEIVDVLLLSMGEEPAIKLAAALQMRAAETSDPELTNALQRMSPMIDATPSQRRTLAEAPQSKVALLLKNRSWWSKSRARGSWDALLTHHRNVIINAGHSTTGKSIDSTLTEHLMAMMTYGLQKAIERNCSGWKDDGRSVSIFSDELSLLAGERSSQVFQWLRNQGRSFGIRCVFATQIPEQLEPLLRSTVTGFNTFLWFAQDDPSVAQVAVSDLVADGSEWSVSDITTLEPYHGIVRTSVAQQRQPSLPVKTLYYPAGSVDRFLMEQDVSR